MSIGVVIADVDNMISICAECYIIDSAYKEGGMYSSVLLAHGKKNTYLDTRKGCLDGVEKLLNKYRVKKILAYNASFDKIHLPELGNYTWCDIMRIAAHKQYNKMIPPNQILKTTVMLLLRNAKMKAGYKDDLKKKMLFFSNVDTLEPNSIRWPSIRFQRNNQTYRMLISICQLIIEGMLITTDSGDYRLASFVDEQRMCRLYEKFILEYYSRHYPELTVTASQIPWGNGRLMERRKAYIL